MGHANACAEMSANDPADIKCRVRRETTAYFLHHEQILSQVPNSLTTSTVVDIFIECQKQGGGGLWRRAAAGEQRGRLIGELENFGGFGFRRFAAIKRALRDEVKTLWRRTCMMACGRLMLMCEREGLGQKHHPSDGWCSQMQA